MNITDTQSQLLIALGLTTLLGALIGYCLAILRAKKNALAAIDSQRFASEAEKNHLERELHAAHRVIEKLRDTNNSIEGRNKVAEKREDALQLHSQLQSQRIQTLETQLASFEQQQIKLKADFASYKATKDRELELARINLGALSESDKIPVLNKRIAEQEIQMFSALETQFVEPDNHYHSEKGGAVLSIPLSRELDIPALSESELPDSVDELDFELAEMERGQEVTRG